MSARITPRNARISPDRPSVGYSTIVLVGVIMLAGYLFSFFAIADAAMWSGVPDQQAWIRFTAPVFIDGAIITYTTAYAVHRWRREYAHATYARRVLYFMTGVSFLINLAHAASAWQWDFARYEALAGSLIAVMAPLASLFSAEQLIKLVFEQGAQDTSAAGQNLDVGEVDATDQATSLPAPVQEDQSSEIPLDAYGLVEPETSVEQYPTVDDIGDAASVESAEPHQFEVPAAIPEAHVLGIEPDPFWDPPFEGSSTAYTPREELPVDDQGFFMVPQQRNAA